VKAWALFWCLYAGNERTRRIYRDDFFCGFRAGMASTISYGFREVQHTARDVDWIHKVLKELEVGDQAYFTSKFICEGRGYHATSVVIQGNHQHPSQPWSLCSLLCSLSGPVTTIRLFSYPVSLCARIEYIMC